MGAAVCWATFWYGKAVRCSLFTGLFRMPYFQPLKPHFIPLFLILSNRVSLQHPIRSASRVVGCTFQLLTIYHLHHLYSRGTESKQLFTEVNNLFLYLVICVHSLKSLILLWGWSFETHITCLFPKKAHSISSLTGMYLIATQSRGLGIWLLGIQIFTHYPVFSPVTHCSLSLFFQESYLTQCLGCELGMWVLNPQPHSMFSALLHIPDIIWKILVPSITLPLRILAWISLPIVDIPSSPQQTVWFKHFCSAKSVMTHLSIFQPSKFCWQSGLLSSFSCSLVLHKGSRLSILYSFIVIERDSGVEQRQKIWDLSTLCICQFPSFVSLNP